MGKLLYEDLTYKIIGAAFEVHKELGPGYLESVYEEALCYELDKNRILYQKQVELDVRYKDVVFERRFRADILIEEKVLVENKAVKALTKQDEAQLLNYLKTTQLKVGLLFNFGSSKLEKIRMIL
ncbi:MAG: GxxExxY protein [Ignavibacteriales bacterium]|nr:GxxExxY protein [Ignavibacteriales bacterium]